MFAKRLGAVSAGFLCLALAVSVQAQEFQPRSLTCTANAKAWRVYDVDNQRWEGNGAKSTFGVATPTSRHAERPLRAKLFSNLHTDTPTVRSLTPGYAREGEYAAEFRATVLLRTVDQVVLTWNNDANKVWLAVIDLEHKKAVVTYVAKGVVSSVEGELETLDCK